jgi:TolB-like protein
MRKALVLILWFLLIAQYSFGAAPRIAAFDLTVQSDNPDHRHVGKGMCEMIVAELQKSAAVHVIERRKRVESLEGSRSSFAEAGQLLAARYVILGDIAELDGEAQVDLRMIDAASGETVWTKHLSGSLEDYSYFAACFAQSILEHLGLPIDHSTIVKVKKPQKARLGAVLALGEALNHYDNDENGEAKADLSRAKWSDPRNEAVRAFLDELILNVSRFKTTTAIYVPIQNPASLGFLQYDQWFTYLYGKLPTPRLSWDLQRLGLSYHSNSGRAVMGYSLPLGKRLGIQVNLLEDQIVSTVLFDSSPDAFFHCFAQNRLGTQVNLGLAVAPNFSIGVGASLYWQFLRLVSLDIVGDMTYIETMHMFPPAFALGFSIQNRDSTLSLDFLAAYSIEKQFDLLKPEGNLYDLLAPLSLDDFTELPIYLEGTLTLAFDHRRAFLSIKQGNDIYLNEAHYIAHLIPEAELWLRQWVCIRAGLSACIYFFHGSIIDYGMGSIGGLTFRLSRRGWFLDIDGFFTTRVIRDWRDAKFNEGSLFIGISRNLLCRAR